MYTINIHMWSSSSSSSVLFSHKESLSDLLPLIMSTMVKGHCGPRVTTLMPHLLAGFLPLPTPPLSLSFILSSLLSTSAGFHLLKQKLTVLLGARSRASLFLQERWENKHGARQYLLSLPGSHLQHRHSAAGEAVLSPHYTPLPPSPVLLSKAMFPWDRPVYQLACQPHDGTPKEHQTVHARMVAVQVRPCSEVHTLSCGHTHAHGLKIIALGVLLSKGILI